jgi:hypothetical protein
MDHIERSNLSRQFLFRAAHIGRAKSSTAAAAAAGLNADFRAQAFETRVGPDSECLFNDAFWDSLDGACNALDNVDARLYVDARCVHYGRPLLESGTLGPKGNTQVVVPRLTDNYGATQDPPAKGHAVCTIKSFPFQIEHTLHWARDVFESEFKQLPDAVKEVNRNLLTTWINDCAVWPLTNFLGFAVVPTKFLPAYMAFNQFLWQVFLSFITLPVGGAEEAPPASQKAATTGEIASPSRRAEVQPNGGDAISDSSVPSQPAAARANAREDTLRALYLELITPLAEGDKDEDWRGERAQAIRNASIGLTILSFSLATRVLIFRI